MIRCAQRDGLWEVLLPVMRHMSEDGRRRFALLPAVHDPEVLGAIIDAAVACDMLQDLLPLAKLLDGEARRVVNERVAEYVR